MKKSLQITTPDLILSLLKADLHHTKLLYGLQEAGVLAEIFYLDLCPVIFQLMGFEKEERDDALYDLYFKNLDRLCEQELHEFLSQQHLFAMELYAELLAEKKMREKMKETAS